MKINILNRLNVTFIKAEPIKQESKTVKESIDYGRVEKFIKRWNKDLPNLLKNTNTEHGAHWYIADEHGCPSDNLPTLNEKEFDYCVKLAHKQGWILTKEKLINNGDGKSILYTMEKINK